MKKAFYCCADKRNEKFVTMLRNSLKKTNPHTPFIFFGEDEIAETNDPHIFTRRTPYYATKLLEEYDVVAQIDADYLVFDNLDHIFEGDFDVAVVHNTNPRENRKYPVSIIDIHPFHYVNGGLQVIKNKSFAKKYLERCENAHAFQYHEQDILNLLIKYGDWKVRDLDDSDKWHGLIVKQYEPYIDLKDGKLVLPQNEEWPQDEDKQVVAYHFAGGFNDPDKGNYRTKFKPEVVKFIDSLVKE